MGDIFSARFAGNARRIPAPSRDWAYFIDFDGTLVELAETPDAIVVGTRLRVLLQHLRQACQGAVAIVTGRTLATMDRHLALPWISAAGMHGSEYRNGASRSRDETHAVDLAPHFERRLAPVLRKHPNLHLENKGAAVALHYRKQPALGAYAKRLIKQTATAYARPLEILSGKYVIEAKPGGADKGRAVRRFLTEPPFKGRLPVFIGDDVTDEDAFRAVNALHGLTIKVGRGRTAARYRLPTISAVHEWLARL